MKHFFYLVLSLFLVSNAFGQNTADGFLGKVPNIPGDPCSSSNSSKQEFTERITKEHDLLRDEIKGRKDEAEKFIKAHEDEAKVNAIKKAGYSEEDAQKLKNADKMTEDQKMAIANKMMMDKMGMSVDDLKKVAKMDTASRRTWAEAYGTMSMADAMANPKKQEEQQLGYKKDYDLVNEMKIQTDKVRAGESKYYQQLDTLRVQSDTAYQIMSRQIDKLNKELEKCRNDGCMKQIDREILGLRKAYCSRFTPSYLTILDNFRLYIQKNIPEYDTLESINNRVTQSQIGLKDPNYKPGLYALSLVDSYYSLAEEVYQYKLFSDEDQTNIGGGD